MKYFKGDITRVTRGIILHGVNCLGVMGSGVALAIKNKWPNVYATYRDMPTGKKMLGTTHFINVGEDLYVANCYTQLNFGTDSTVRYADLNAVDKCLQDCYNFAHLNELPICSVKIASLRGGLHWENEVEPIFLRLNTEYNDIDVTIYYI